MGPLGSICVFDANALEWSLASYTLTRFRQWHQHSIRTLVLLSIDSKGRFYKILPIPSVKNTFAVFDLILSNINTSGQ